jgi:hypothetical protein
MKSKKILAGVGLLLSVVFVLAGCGGPTVDERAVEYLSKYNDTFELVSQSENQGAGQQTAGCAENQQCDSASRSFQLPDDFQQGFFAIYFQQLHHHVAAS